MPIYAYRCAACGHTKDVLRKLSDPPLADCPACGEPRFEKQVTAAGFQLKGSGWYVTDFRNPPASGAAKSDGEGDKAAADKAAVDKGAGDKVASDKAPSDKADKSEPAKPASPTNGAAAPAVSPAPAPAAAAPTAAAAPAAPRSSSGNAS